MKQTIAIINFNTPELTEACILSIRKHGGRNYRVVVFDNSDKRPFCVQMQGVEVIDNTCGQVINFEAMLAAFPDRDASIGCAKGCDYGSTKHMMTVQKLWELLPDGFVLVESDILLKRDIEEFFDPTHSVYGYHQKAQPHNPFGIGRMLPMLCWMNVPLLTKYGAKYFDPKRTYGLLPGGRQNRNNWYDTGAVLLEDIIKNRPNLVGRHIDIREFVEHFGSGSWKNNNLKTQAEWLKQHRNLWEIPKPTVALMAMGRGENQYAQEWVAHHLALGFDKIIIFDNNREGEENFYCRIGNYVDAGQVEIELHPEPYGMIAAYQKTYNERGKDFDWLMALDFDEFLMLPEGEDIHSFVERFAYTADVVKVNWMTYGDNGLVVNDGRPLQVRFTEPLRGEDGSTESYGENVHVKSIARCGLPLVYRDPHCPHGAEVYMDAHGNRSEASPFVKEVNHSGAYIKHFTTKTLEEWMENKVKRGQCDCVANTEGLQKNAISLFFARNEKTKEKLDWLKKNGYLVDEPEKNNDIEPPSFDEAQGTPVPAQTESKPKARKRTNKKEK